MRVLLPALALVASVNASFMVDVVRQVRDNHSMRMSEIQQVAHKLSHSDLTEELFPRLLGAKHALKKTMGTSHSNRHFSQQATCQESAVALMEKLAGEEGAAVSDAMADPAITKTAADSIGSALCLGKSEYLTLVDAVKADCTAEEMEANGVNPDEIAMGLELMCSKDGAGASCFHDFLMMTGEGAGHIIGSEMKGDKISASSMKKICTPCYNRLLLGVAKMSVSDDGDEKMRKLESTITEFALKLMCLKANGEYCLPAMADMEEIMEKPANFCKNACAQKMVTHMYGFFYEKDVCGSDAMNNMMGAMMGGGGGGEGYRGYGDYGDYADYGGVTGPTCCKGDYGPGGDGEFTNSDRAWGCQGCNCKDYDDMDEKATTDCAKLETQLKGDPSTAERAPAPADEETTASTDSSSATGRRLLQDDSMIASLAMIGVASCMQDVRSQMKMMCIKDGDKYCIEIMDPTSGMTDSEMMAFAEEEEKKEDEKEEARKGKKCQLIDAEKGDIDDKEWCKPMDSCSSGDNADCKAILTEELSEGPGSSCCLWEMLDGMEKMLDELPKEARDAHKASGEMDPTCLKSTMATCGIKTDMCKRGRKKVRLRAAVRNVAFSYYEKNKDKVEKMIKTDIAANAGVDSDAVTINSVTKLAESNRRMRRLLASEGGIVVDADIETVSDDQAELLTESMTAMVEGGEMTFDTLEAELPDDGKIDPNAMLTFDGEASEAVEEKVVSEDGNGVAGLSPAKWVFALGALFLALF